MASTGKGPDRPPEERWEQRTRGDSHTQAPPLRCCLSSTHPRPNRRINAGRLTEEQGTDPTPGVESRRSEHKVALRAVAGQAAAALRQVTLNGSVSGDP